MELWERPGGELYTMSKVNGNRPPLLVQVWAELGAGRITEDPELRSDVKGERLHGLQEGRHIWVNPTFALVDTIVHELLHRLHPEWSERYVRNRTAYLMTRMTDEEIVAVYDEYERRKRKRKRVVR